MGRVGRRAAFGRKAASLPGWSSPNQSEAYRAGEARYRHFGHRALLVVRRPPAPPRATRRSRLFAHPAGGAACRVTAGFEVREHASRFRVHQLLDLGTQGGKLISDGAAPPPGAEAPE